MPGYSACALNQLAIHLYYYKRSGFHRLAPELFPGFTIAAKAPRCGHKLWPQAPWGGHHYTALGDDWNPRVTWPTVRGLMDSAKHYTNLRPKSCYIVKLFFTCLNAPLSSHQLATLANQQQLQGPQPIFCPYWAAPKPEKSFRPPAHQCPHKKKENKENGQMDNRVRVFITPLSGFQNVFKGLWKRHSVATASLSGAKR